nr:DUF2752 domain-containing protein [Bacteroides sp.]
MNRRTILILICVAACILPVVYAVFDPSSSAFFPRCPLKVLTGYDCPGCGSQRAFHALLHGDIAAVVRYNALFLPAVALAALLLMPDRFAPARRLRSSVWLPWAVGGVTVAWWIGRNLI